MLLRLGNTLADGTETYTEVGPFPEGTPLAEAIAVLGDLWGYHAPSLSGAALVDSEGKRVKVDDPAPARWVASDSPALAAVMAEEHKCEIRELVV